MNTKSHKHISDYTQKEHTVQQAEKSDKAADEKISLDSLEDDAASKTDSSSKKMQKEIDSLKQQLAGVNDKYVRLCADYDNFRKRSAKERENIFDDAYVSAINSFLPIYDNIERATAQACSDGEFKKGVDLIFRQFHDIFNKLNVEEVPGVGEQFNPEYHHAIMHVDDDSVGENVVVEVIQKGFSRDGHIIRYALVKSAN